MQLNRRTIPIIILILFGIFLTGAVLFLNAIPKEVRVLESINAYYDVRDAGFQRESGLLTGREWVSGNSISVLENGEAIYSAMLDAIRSAEESVTFETYQFHEGTVGNEFAEALAGAADRGVRVHVLMDYLGSIDASDDQFEMMKDAGVELIRWRNPSWYQIARFNYRTHRKLLNKDGRIAYTGGANITDDWIGGIEHGAFRDFHYELRGAVAAELQGAFSENWVASTGKLLSGPAYYPELEEAGNLLMQVSSSHPQEGVKKMRKMFLYALASARESIRLTTAYFYPDQSFLDALEDASNRGVHVQILVPGESINKGFVRHASVNQWRGILEAGVEIYEFQPSMYHAKLAIIDDYLVSIGSSNLDNRSFRLNDETNVNILDDTFAEEMVRFYNHDLDHSESYTLEDWENRSLRSRLYGRMAQFFGWHL